jgi:hypothetical protein
MVEHGRGGGGVNGPLLREIGQSVYLMALMAAVLGAYVGMGLLAIRVLG